MADAYTTLGIAADPQDAVAEMEADFAVRVPGWVPAAGSLLVAAFETVALQIARVGAAIEAKARDDFSAAGETLFQEPVRVDEHAYGLVTFTANHANGVAIPAGTAFSGSDTAGGEVVFQTTSNAIIEAPGTTVSGVPVEAVEAGLLASPITGTGTMISSVDGIPVDGVEFDEPTTAGASGETQDEYTERLTRRLRLLKSGPVTPDDYDVFLRTSLTPVYRVLVRDTFDPVAHTSGHAGMMTVSMIDSAGTWVGSAVDLDAAQLIANYREVNDITHIIAPTVTTIDVHYSVIIEDGYDPAFVIAECDAAVASFLSPATWGLPRIGDEPGWVLKTTVRPVGMIGPVIGMVEGVESVEAVTARTGANAYATTAITLTGDAPLASLGAVVGTDVTP